MKTVRIVSEHPPSQGPWVLLNESDFDPARHAIYQDAPAVPEQSDPPTKRRGRPPKTLTTTEYTNGNR
jgi:hypothetical protein